MGVNEEDTESDTESDQDTVVGEEPSPLPVLTADDGAFSGLAVSARTSGSLRDYRPRSPLVPEDAILRRGSDETGVVICAQLFACLLCFDFWRWN